MRSGARNPLRPEDGIAAIACPGQVGAGEVTLVGTAVPEPSIAEGPISECSISESRPARPVTGERPLAGLRVVGVLRDRTGTELIGSVLLPLPAVELGTIKLTTVKLPAIELPAAKGGGTGREIAIPSAIARVSLARLAEARLAEARLAEARLADLRRPDA